MGIVQIPKTNGVAGLPSGISVDTGNLRSVLLNRSRGVSLVVAIHIHSDRLGYL